MWAGYTILRISRLIKTADRVLRFLKHTYRWHREKCAQSIVEVAKKKFDD